jgi:hypothetical protein
MCFQALIWPSNVRNRCLCFVVISLYAAICTLFWVESFHGSRVYPSVLDCGAQLADGGEASGREGHGVPGRVNPPQRLT